MRTSYEYDGRGMIWSLRHSNDGSGRDLAKRDYWRDDRDRIRAWKRGTDNFYNRADLGADLGSVLRMIESQVAVDGNAGCPSSYESSRKGDMGMMRRGRQNGNETMSWAAPARGHRGSDACGSADRGSPARDGEEKRTRFCGR